jgi:predicted RNA-binding Zn-ribbon protein involved in translation (DUF1610 family)
MANLTISEEKIEDFKCPTCNACIRLDKSTIDLNSDTKFYGTCPRCESELVVRIAISINYLVLNAF